MNRPTAAFVRSLVPDLESALGGPSTERRREVEILLAHAAGLAARTDLYLRGLDLTGELRGRATDLARRRAAGEPVAYLVGRCEFYGLEFAVDPRVLIPRPETEHVVEETLRRLGANGDAELLEVGVGSGAISVSILTMRRGARAIATDVSPGALEVAAENARRHRVDGRLTLVEADIAPAVAQTFDLVVSNPPYVATADPLPADVRDHEPASALFAGPDGLDVIDRIVSAAPDILRPGGALVMEVGAGQASTVSARMADAGFTDLARVRDVGGVERVVSGLLG